MRIRRTPELHFVYDDTIRTAARIEELLSEEVEKAQERERNETAENASKTDDL